MRHAGLTILLFAALMLLGLRAMQSVDPDSQLQEAIQSLKGERKDTGRATKLLLEIVQNRNARVRPRVLAWSYNKLARVAA